MKLEEEEHMVSNQKIREWSSSLTAVLCMAAFIVGAACPAKAEPVPETVPEANKAFKVSADWTAGKLENYGPAKVSYTGQPIILRMSTHTPDVSGVTKFNRAAGKILERMSDGKIKLEIKSGGVVHSVSEGFTANRSGITDMSPCFVFLNPTNFPLTQALSLPGLFPDAAVLSMVAEKLYPKYFRAEFERQGVYALGFVGSVRFRLFSKTPIRTLEEIKGKKVRSGGGINQQIFQALGAATVNMSSRDFQQGLQRGLLDAIYTSDAAGLIFKLDQAATDHTDVNINHVELEWCMNRRTFDKLPHDLKVVVNNWARANFQAESQQVFLKLAVIARNKFKKEGMKFHSLTDAEAKRWAEAYENVTQDYLTKTEAKGLPARELVADIKALVEQYKGKTFNELMLETINNPDQSFSRGVK